jgi:aldose sugar dehydrogenase
MVSRILFIFALFSGSLIIFSAIYAAPCSSVYASTEQQPEIPKDDELEADLVYDGEELGFATGMAFLGEDDILVTEKNTGKIKRIINGNMVEEPLLDVHVVNKFERGLLGIAVSDGQTADDKTYVFLYFTESPNEEDGSDKCDLVNYCSSGPVGHRLYRYELNDNALVNPKLLLDIPPNIGADHLGGAIVIGPDENVYLVTGDGDSCENGTCESGIEDTVLNSKSSNIENGSRPEGRGGVLRVTQDGNIVKGQDESAIFGEDEHPLDMYYAYGIRNSFGIDFDPLTGKLWDTENGPGFGDEINLVEPGFNSGWVKMQGVWPISNFSLLDPNPMVRGLHDDQLTSKTLESELFDFNNTGKYSEPEFTWNIPVGVTAIKFFNSDKLGKEYENDLFVGDYVKGNLYHFDLNSLRTELELGGQLADKVSNNTREIRQVVFAEGFGGITDIEVSPDGYLHILSPSGEIYRIVNNPD